MNTPDYKSHLLWKYTLFSSLVFILFFQLVPDFIESVYAFGLLGTEIPPQIVSILFFFSPALLLLFPKKVPTQMIYLAAVLVAIARSMEVVLDPVGKMLASGFGVGCLFLLLPVMSDALWHSEDEHQSADISLGLLIALTVVILLRVLAAGSDISSTHPAISWLLSLALIPATIATWREKETQLPSHVGSTRSSLKVWGLSIGVVSCLLVLYFAFISPTVISRWSELDYRVVVAWLAISLMVYYVLLAYKILDRLSQIGVWFWNGAFVISGVIALLIYQEVFPAESNAYPFYQREIQSWQHIPLFLFIALCPIILYDFKLFMREMENEKASPRELGEGFLLGACFFLLVILGQVFTTTYDYIPLVGPWFRDRFWLVFLIAGLGMILPIISVRKSSFQKKPPLYSPILFPILVTILGVAVIWVIFSEPSPEKTSKKSTLNVLTYNIQQGYSPAGERSFEEQLALIRKLDPDIVGLQESDTARFSGGNADIVRTISQGLKMYSYYGPRTVTGTFGVALLSRYPLENPRTFFMYSLGEQTATIEATVTVNNKKYLILVTHLGNGGPIIQQENMLTLLAGRQNAIILGDFNYEPTTEQYRLITQTLADAWVLAGSPVPKGLQADTLIDHIFISPEIAVLSAQYIDYFASDHPLLWVKLAP